LKRSIFIICLPFLLVLAIVSLGEPVQAKYPAPGKSIEFIVPVGVGGGYDLYARMLVPYLAKELDAKIRIRNEPEGVWLVGLKQIYTAKPDGYTIGVWNPGVLMNDRDILGKVDYDMTSFTYLYRITNEPRIVIVKKDGPVKDFKDLVAKGRSSGFKLRNSYAGGTGLLDAKLMDAEWKIDTEKIPYKSGSAGRMAVMRGDVHFCVSSLGAAPDILSSGRLKVILLLDDEPMEKVGEARTLIRDFPELKNVPIPKDLGLPPLSYNTRGARAIIAPPGIPKDVKKTLEAALEKIMKDKGFIELGFKADRPLGIGQNGDDYAAQMKRDKQALLKIKHLLAE
jgi:tripartite-type tricarboxylate transporter receptor subunit TctC